jgi:glycerol kinase
MDEIASSWELERRFEPAMSDDQRESLYAGWKRAVERMKGWEQHG